MSRNALKQVEKIILAHGAARLRRVNPRQIPTAEWVRLKCQFGCDGYGQCLTCPPYAPTPDQTRRLLDGYSTGFLIYWGHEAGGRKALAQMERQAFLKGWHKAFAMGSGPCELCRECDLEGPCAHPSQARPSMEACGIDVFQTARNAGFPIQVVACRRGVPDFYSLLLLE
jgi:predicted metal-binding protein